MEQDTRYTLEDWAAALLCSPYFKFHDFEPEVVASKLFSFATALKRAADSALKLEAQKEQIKQSR